MKKKEANFVSAVVYTSDESRNIEKFLKQLIDGLDAHFQHFEIILVDDCCKKNREVIDAFCTTVERAKMITVVRMSIKQGIETCLRAGLDVSIGDFVFEFDTLDFDFSTELLWNVYKSAIEGNDIVSVVTKHNSMSRKLFYKLFNNYSYSDYDINATLFRLVSRRAINRVLTLKMDCSFRQAAYASCGLKNSDVEYDGRANSKKERGMNLAIDSFLLYTSIPQKVCVLLFICLLFMSAIGIGGMMLFVFFDCMAFVSIFGISLMADIIIIFFMIFMGINYAKLILKGNSNTYLIESIEKV